MVNTRHTLASLKDVLFTKKKKNLGFTLIELLVSMIVAGIVVSGLLYLVVELLQIDQREAALTQTQRDMQRALDYIADDVREAVYIYNNPSDVVGSGKVSDLPANSVPVLAFWRPRPVDQDLPNGLPADLCDPWAPGGATPDVEKYDQCQVLEIRQASYSLVVYAQKARTASDTVWKGASRIVRYELDAYKGTITDLVRTPGYQDPTSSSVGFESWQAHPGETTVGVANVLVDFVDTPATTTAVSTPTNPCGSLGLDTAQYSVVPAGLAMEQDPSFLGCVRNSVVAAASGTAASNSSQDVYLYLRGNAIDGSRGAINSFSEASSLPTLETRVLMRGVVNKNPT